MKMIAGQSLPGSEIDVQAGSGAWRGGPRSRSGLFRWLLCCRRSAAVSSAAAATPVPWSLWGSTRAVTPGCFNLCGRRKAVPPVGKRYRACSNQNWYSSFHDVAPAQRHNAHATSCRFLLTNEKEMGTGCSGLNWPDARCVPPMARCTTFGDKVCGDCLLRAWSHRPGQQGLLQSCSDLQKLNSGTSAAERTHSCSSAPCWVVPFVPSSCTTVAAPAIGAGQRRQWRGGTGTQKWYTGSADRVSVDGGRAVPAV